VHDKSDTCDPHDEKRNIGNHVDRLLRLLWFQRMNPEKNSRAVGDVQFPRVLQERKKGIREIVFPESDNKRDNLNKRHSQSIEAPEDSF
jgi:hypothetical protein